MTSEETATKKDDSSDDDDNDGTILVAGIMIAVLIIATAFIVYASKHRARSKPRPVIDGPPFPPISVDRIARVPSSNALRNTNL